MQSKTFFTADNTGELIGNLLNADGKDLAAKSIGVAVEGNASFSTAQNKLLEQSILWNSSLSKGAQDNSKPSHKVKLEGEEQSPLQKPLSGQEENGLQPDGSPTRKSIRQRLNIRVSPLKTN